MDQASHAMSDLVDLLRGVDPQVDAMSPVSTLLWPAGSLSLLLFSSLLFSFLLFTPF
jgi:hypothetical protein